MIADDLASVADTNFFGAWAALCAAIPRGFAVEDGELLFVSCGIPYPFFNSAFAVRTSSEPAEAVARTLAFFGERGLPFQLRLRSGADRPLEVAATAAGLRNDRNLPGMALHPLPRPASIPSGLEIRESHDAGDLGDHAAVCAGGFGMPLDWAQQLTPIELLAIPGQHLYVGYMDGRPVCSSALFFDGVAAGVYNVATLGPWRRRGLGEAMTWHAITAGADAGAEIAILQATDMGLPVYERMGFRVVSPYRVFELPS